jgi:hypothetical protein
MKFLKITTIIISALLILTLSACGKKLTPFTLEEVTNVSVSGGINGEGEISVRLSPKGYETIIEANFPDGLTDLDEAQNIMLFEAGIKIEVDGETKNVKNGDTITVSAIYSEEAFKELGSDMTENSFTYTVEGLKEPTVVDVFEGVAVDFEGMSGEANATINTDNCPTFIKDNVKFSIKDNNNRNLSNGDNITIVAGGNYADSAEFTENAYKVEVTEKAFAVDGLPFYITEPKTYDMSEIDSIVLQKANETMNDTFSVGSILAGDTIAHDAGGHMFDKWTINSVTLAPEVIKYMQVNTKHNSFSADAPNGYMTFFTVIVNATKTEDATSLFGGGKDGYDNGDTADFDIALLVNVMGLIDNGDGVAEYTDDSFGTRVYTDYDDKGTTEDVITAIINNNPNWEFTKIS